MDLQDLAEQSHNIIAATFLRKNKIIARTCKLNFKFLAEDYFRRPNYFFIAESKFAKKKSFTSKWSDNCWSNKIAEET